MSQFKKVVQYIHLPAKNPDAIALEKKSFKEPLNIDGAYIIGSHNVEKSDFVKKIKKLSADLIETIHAMETCTHPKVNGLAEKLKDKAIDDIIGASMFACKAFYVLNDQRKLEDKSFK